MWHYKENKNLNISFSLSNTCAWFNPASDLTKACCAADRPKLCTCLKACSRATERALDPATMPCEYWRPSRTTAGWITVVGMLRRQRWWRHINAATWINCFLRPRKQPTALRGITWFAESGGICDCTGGGEKRGWLYNHSLVGGGSEMK